MITKSNIWFITMTILWIVITGAIALGTNLINPMQVVQVIKDNSLHLILGALSSWHILVVSIYNQGQAASFVGKRY